MYAFIQVYAHVCMYMYMCICVHVCAYVRAYVYVCAYACVCMCAHVNVCGHGCLSACVWYESANTRSHSVSMEDGGQFSGADSHSSPWVPGIESQS